ncbi:MAG: DUF1684 domain-containing protein [Bernardetiaceae bacterium]
MKQLLYVFAAVLLIGIIGYTFWQPAGPNADQQQAYYDVIRKQRQQKDQMFKSGKDSPLTDEQKETFTALDYYPPAWTFRFTAQLDYFSADKPTIQLPTNTGETQTVRPIGFAFFRSGEKRIKLTVYQSLDEDTYFLPFRDLTTGKTTYPAGRYLEPKVRGKVIEIDFNYAYNPYCAYNENYVCPLPPEENTLPIAVEAGEKYVPL